MCDNTLSMRMAHTVEGLLPGIDATIKNRASALIDLATAENWLIRDELVAQYKAGIEQAFSSKDLSYPQGLGGNPELLAALAAFFNKHFAPAAPVLPRHIVATPGATSCLDALLYTICDEGDAVLVPAPFWNGFQLHFHLRPRVKIIPVLTRFSWDESYETTTASSTSAPTPCDLLTEPLTPALEAAYRQATSPGRKATPSRVRALIMTNPHNPLARCYPQRVLAECLRFCETRGLHYVSDEVYAMSQVGHSQLPDDGGVEMTKPTSNMHTVPGFTSILSVVADMAERESADLGTRTLNTAPPAGVQRPGKRRRVSSSRSAPVTRLRRTGLRGQASPATSRAENGMTTGSHQQNSVQRQGKRSRSPEGDGDDGGHYGHAAKCNVHVIWSLSKDFGSSGVRLAALLSQHPLNRPLLASVALLSGMHLSSLTSTAATALLTSPELPQLVQLAAARLRDAHATAAAAFRAWGVRFVAPAAGPFVFARLLLLPPPQHAGVGEAGEVGTGVGTAAEDERALADRLKKEGGVSVVPGSAFGGWGSWGGAAGGGDGVVGWFRITVAVPPDVLREGLARIGRVLLEGSKVTSNGVGSE